MLLDYEKARVKEGERQVKKLQRSKYKRNGFRMRNNSNDEEIHE